MAHAALEAMPRVKLSPEPGRANKTRITRSLEPTRKKDTHSPESIRGVSIKSSCSSDSRRSDSAVKDGGFQRRRRHGGARSVKIVPEGVGEAALQRPVLAKMRCSWVTLNSEQVYISFHDEEWGVPVHDDKKLFELLVSSQALAELSWPTILNKKNLFRKLFMNFDPSSVAKFSEKKILSLKSDGNTSLSEQKLRAVVQNARQILKVIEEFGSFGSYCWSFVNHKPIVNEFRYARLVPAKTPKAEVISKDMMQRGFRCVGPTVIYSFMQAAGIVNDHLSSCFRYQECIRSHTEELKLNADDKL